MRREGFTITELIVVLVMIAASMAVALPAMVDAYQRWSVRTGADEFASAHRLARSSAVWYGRLAELHVDPASGHFWVEVDTATGAVMKDTVGPVKRLKPGVQLSLDPADRDVICFDARGVPALSSPCDLPGVTLLFEAGDKQVEVRSTGLGKLLR